MMKYLAFSSLLFRAVPSLSLMKAKAQRWSMMRWASVGMTTMMPRNA